MAAESTCAQCGGTDDHPKHHYAKSGEEVQTHHFDCLPHTVMQDITHVTTHEFVPEEGRFKVAKRVELKGDELPDTAKFILATRKQAEGGKRGDDLRAWIIKNGPRAQED